MKFADMRFKHLFVARVHVFQSKCTGSTFRLEAGISVLDLRLSLERSIRQEEEVTEAGLKLRQERAPSLMKVLCLTHPSTHTLNLLLFIPRHLTLLFAPVVTMTTTGVTA